ncbi:inverse autotransporter beta domain-containing protein [Escherichia coli]|nr:inverse autotransporter beta domain-containing protein [Escherichia coli]
MTDDKALNYAAQQAASLGSQLQSRSLNGDYAKDTALGMASSQASSQLQAWLQHYGTAEVNLQSGNNFDGSSLTSYYRSMIPKNMLAFGQVGARYIDSRFTANLEVLASVFSFLKICWAITSSLIRIFLVIIPV